MPENQNTEWKESWRDEYLKWVSGFSNAKGGTIVIGKADDGTIVGVKDHKKLMEDLPNKMKNMLGILPEINLIEETGKHYIEIIVEPSKSPVAHKGQFYLRRGSTNQLLDGQALSDFVLEKSNLKWDEVPFGSATIQDINEETVNSFKQRAIAEGRIPSLTEDTPTEMILRNLNLITKEGKITRAALILFGKDPKQVEFTAYLKIGKFGNSPTDLISQDMLEMNGFDLALQTIEILNTKYITRKISYNEARRIETPEYPYDALREVLYNAIIHRKYTSSPITVRLYPDRIRIWNIGTLPDEIDIEKLKVPHSSVPRNELMANVFYMAGFIESWGRGTLKVIEECKKHGLPEPQIEEDQGGVAVTLFKDIYSEEYLSRFDLNNRQKKTLQYIKEHGYITTSLHSEEFDVGMTTSKRDISELVKLSFIKTEGIGKNTRYIIDVYGYKQK